MDIVTCIRYSIVVDFLPPFLPPSQSFLCPFLNGDATVAVVVEDIRVGRNVEVTAPIVDAQYNLCQIDILWLSVNMYDEVRMLVFSYCQLVPSRFFHRTPPQVAPHFMLLHVYVVAWEFFQWCQSPNYIFCHNP